MVVAIGGDIHLRAMAIGIQALLETRRHSSLLGCLVLGIRRRLVERRPRRNWLSSKRPMRRRKKMHSELRIRKRRMHSGLRNMSDSLVASLRPCEILSVTCSRPLAIPHQLHRDLAWHLPGRLWRGFHLAPRRWRSMTAMRVQLPFFLVYEFR